MIIIRDARTWPSQSFSIYFIPIPVRNGRLRPPQVLRAFCVHSIIKEPNLKKFCMKSEWVNVRILNQI